MISKSRQKFPILLAGICVCTLAITVIIVGGTAAAAGGEPARNPLSLTETAALDPQPVIDLAAIAQASQQPKSPKLQSSLKQVEEQFQQRGMDAATALAADKRIDMKDGKATVVIESQDGGGAVQAVKEAGGDIQTTYNNLIQAMVPVQNLTALSNAGQVGFIREPRHPTLSATTSEGVADIGADAWKDSGKRGAGAKVAVLDGGFAGYGSRISAGDLPANVVVRSFRSDGDITSGGESHGTACAEIVYDIAPDAQLYIVNFDTEVELGNAVNYLISEGVDVVSASWAFQPFRGDGQGLIDSMAASARANGIFWANASGNEAQNHWWGSFSDTDGNGLLNFSGSDNGNWFYAPAGAHIYAWTTWNRWPDTNQDYDLYLVNSSGNVVASSTSLQTGSQEPVEQLGASISSPGNYGIVIKRYNADGNAFFNLMVDMCSSSGCGSSNLSYGTAAGSIGGEPADSANVMTVGAIPAGGNSIEAFSSQGPTLDGRIKPDIAAPDGVSTATYGYQGFYGTSAAAPHAAGAATLVKGANPLYSPAMIQSALEGWATDLGAPGKDNVYGSGKLRMGNAIDYYWSWYDSSSMKNWILMANPAGSARNLQFILGIAGRGFDPGNLGYGTGIVPAGKELTAIYPGGMGGPVEISSNTGDQAVVSQRSLMGSSFEEVLGTEAGKLSDHFYWTWYDNASAGMTNWILIANQNASPVYYEIMIAGNLVKNGFIASGGNVTPTFPRAMGGPVEVRAWTDQSRAAPAKVIASQRVVSGGGGAFNEVPGIADDDLSNHYYWTWYDANSPQARDWILISNPGAVAVSAQIKIAGVTRWQGNVARGGTVTPVFPGVMGGPVEVIASGDVIASQRITWGPSLEEVPGYPAGNLSTDLHWTWYDMQSGGSSNWVLISNPGSSAVNAQVKIGGITRWSGTIGPGGSVTPTFRGVMGGPVEVISSGRVMASQRVTWNGFFNEVMGAVLN